MSNNSQFRTTSIQLVPPSSPVMEPGATSSPSPQDDTFDDLTAGFSEMDISNVTVRPRHAQAKDHRYNFETPTPYLRNEKQDELIDSSSIVDTTYQDNFDDSGAYSPPWITTLPALPSSHGSDEELEETGKVIETRHPPSNHGHLPVCPECGVFVKDRVRDCKDGVWYWYWNCKACDKIFWLSGKKVLKKV